MDTPQHRESLAARQHRGLVPREEDEGSPLAWALRGLVAGAVGTFVLEATSSLDTALSGRRPVYAPERIAKGLFANGRGSFVSRHARTLGRLLRWTYGPLLGLAAEAARPLVRPPVLRGLAIGGTVMAFELIAMPALGATPPLRQWPRGQLVRLGIHTAAFGLATAAAQRALREAREPEEEGS